MSCLPMLSRVNDLKRRLQGLNEEAESAVSNIKSIVDRGKSLVVYQESIHDPETFLRKYPLAVADLDVLVNNLVKFNCELEIALSKSSDTLQGSNFDSSNSECRTCITFPVDTRSVFTNTEQVCVNSLLTGNLDVITQVYKIETGSILEMKHLLGDCPSDFWLGYYSNEESVSLNIKLREYLKLGQCQRLESPPSIGQYIIGSVFRGYVLSVYCERIVALDIDTGIVKFTSVGEVWEMKEDILKFPPQAICCRLSHLPSELDWCDELKLIFEKFMSNCNLVISVEDILPTMPPTFVVDIDAHEGTRLDFNVSNWIMDYVIPGIKKLKSFDLCDSKKESVFCEIDPYSAFCDENEEIGESVLSNPFGNVSASNVDEFSLQSDCGQNISDIFDNETINATSVCIKEVTESPVAHNFSSTSSFNSSCNVSSSVVSSSQTVEDIQSLIEIDFEPTHSNTDILRSENIVATSLPCGDDTKVTHIFEEFVPRGSDGDGTVHINVKQTCEEEEVNTSVEVECILEKGTSVRTTQVKGDYPWNFIVNLEVNEKFKSLMKEIGERGKSDKLKHFMDLPKVNGFAIGKFEDLYFRARICASLQDCDDYFVLNIDTGEHKVLNILDIFVLEEEFASLPAQSIVCSLWHIPREPPYWNSNLGALFGEVIQENVLKVTIKDVVQVANSWNHLVQVRISSAVDFDLSEWFMLYVMPKLLQIKNMDTVGEDCGSIVKMLDPINLYSKSMASRAGTNLKINSLVLNESTNSKLFSKHYLRKPHSANEYINLSDTSDHLNVISDHVSLIKYNESLSSIYSEEIKVNKTPSISNSTQKLDSSENFSDFKTTSDLKIGEKYYAYLSNILSPCEFYVHLVTDDNTKIDKFQSKLQEFYSGQIINYKTKEEVKQLISNCCAVNFEGQWCRAKIIDWMDYSKNYVYVFIVDFGIYASLPFNSIQCLKSDFYEQPLFALKCKMAQIRPPMNGNNWPEEAKQYFSSILDFSNIYTLYVEGNSGSGATTVFLSVKGEAESINDNLVNEGLAVSLKPNSSNLKSEKSHSIVYPPPEAFHDMFSSEDESDDEFQYNRPNVDIVYFDDNSTNIPSVGEEMTVVVTELVSLCSFYGVVNVQRKYLGRFCYTNDVLQQMSEKIERAVNSGLLRIVKNALLGAVVVAKFSHDNVWYRARLLTPVDDDGFAKVFFVDYGNIDLVSKKHLREISKEFSSLPFQAVRFFINGIDLSAFEGKIREKCKNMMCSLLGKYVNIRVVRIVNGDIIVDVYSEGSNVALKLLSVQAKGSQVIEM